MRTFLIAFATVFVAGCAATAPRTDLGKVYDRKYNITTYMAKQPVSEFVGTGADASASTKAKPSWYRYGHP